MRTLLTYCVTGPALTDFVENTLPVQQRLAPKLYDACERLLVCDTSDAVPASLPMPVLRTRLFDVHGGLNVSAGRNLCLDYGARAGVDYLAILDADAVLLHLDLSTPLSGDITMLRLMDGDRDGQRQIELLEGNYGCYFLMTAAVVNRCRYRTCFTGHGYEDTDFLNNVVIEAGFQVEKPTYERSRILHLAHPLRGWHTEERFRANAVLYVAEMIRRFRRHNWPLDPELLAPFEREVFDEALALQ